MAEVDEEVGKGIVIQEFLINEDRKKVPVAGTKVTHGKFDKNRLIKVLRSKGGGESDLLTEEASLSSLKHKKLEVGQITQGHDCGVRLKGDPIRFEAGDEIIFYEKKNVARQIEWNTGF